MLYIEHSKVFITLNKTTCVHNRSKFSEAAEYLHPILKRSQQNASINMKLVHIKLYSTHRLKYYVLLPNTSSHFEAKVAPLYN